MHAMFCANSLQSSNNRRPEEHFFRAFLYISITL